jgi:hypothetical protein
MSPHSLKYPRRVASITVCREALRVGYLVCDGAKGWSFGRRRFHCGIVNQLIDNGEAVRVGNCVVRWRPA